MTRLPIYIALILIVSSAFTFANKAIEALRKDKHQIEFQITTLEASGLGKAHPSIKRLKARHKELSNKLKELNDQIQELDQNFKETIIFLEGTESKYMQGHHKYGTTTKALQELLFSGWRIRQTIPAGEKSAYVWLYIK